MSSTDQIEIHSGDLRFTALTAGESGNPLVICLHGFPDAATTFHQQFAPLVDAGYRVVAPTLRGYEPSSQPVDGDYSLVTMADDVANWIDDLGAEAAHLVGHDWGAVIASVAAARHPDRVISLTTLAIPPLARIPAAVRRVPRQLLRSWYMTFFQLPGVADRSLAARKWWLMRRLWRTWSPGLEISDEHWNELQTQFEAPGVVNAALQYYRQNATPLVLTGIRSSPAMAYGVIPVPTLIMHGSDDGCMDRRMFDAAIQPGDHPAGLTRCEIEGAGHFLHLERAEKVNVAILDHLESSGTTG